MARRRKISAPSAEDLSRFEEEFTAERTGRDSASSPSMAPIAQVARDAAVAGQPLPQDLRQVQARDRRDADLLRVATAEGRLMVELPTGSIDEAVMVRDRTIMDPEEMAELKRSIMSNGLRLPIEVFDQGEDAGPRRYGLISGYRRLRAIRELHAEQGLETGATIRAIIRNPDEMGGALVAMVEENEIRAQLTHYERGRIAAVGMQQGLFGTVEEAVNVLFASASKAKRSKIRAFALIHEELGDMLSHGESLREKDGLKLAQALRHGGQARLREALDLGPASSGPEEWKLLEPAIADVEDNEMAMPDRGGRPRAPEPGARWVTRDRMVLSSGVSIEYGYDNGAHVLKLRGKNVDRTLMESAMEELARLFDQP
ncbi:ParB/RepB/Spo0J family partition protein [Palleronia sp. LCG004]|uniref:ParB/RepB/Spo0J family partition protein n=1 Tax=Palleronia sp. LCG004 TaxID=3079304 RepID=UPI002941CD3E|nr:ParB N-terminal domain-containing protein [Palleronia sp. LCG004]WOI57847.1 ParB N-terminal domain-containing protein [Palleronia sp. LCG004]